MMRVTVTSFYIGYLGPWLLYLFFISLNTIQNHNHFQRAQTGEVLGDSLEATQNSKEVIAGKALRRTIEVCGDWRPTTRAYYGPYQVPSTFLILYHDQDARMPCRGQCKWFPNGVFFR